MWRGGRAWPLQPHPLDHSVGSATPGMAPGLCHRHRWPRGRWSAAPVQNRACPIAAFPAEFPFSAGVRSFSATVTSVGAAAPGGPVPLPWPPLSPSRIPPPSPPGCPPPLSLFPSSAQTGKPLGRRGQLPPPTHRLQPRLPPHRPAKPLQLPPVFSVSTRAGRQLPAPLRTGEKLARGLLRTAQKSKTQRGFNLRAAGPTSVTHVNRDITTGD